MKMKKIYYFILSAVMVWAIVACGKEKPHDAPSSRDVKRDIKEYIQEMIDETADILEYEITDENEENDNYAVTADVLYEDSTGKNRSEFSLKYDWQDDDWELTKCSMEEPELVEKSTEYEDVSDDNGDSLAAEQSEGLLDEEEKSAEQESSLGQLEAYQSVVEDVSEMSDDLYDFTFTLDNVIYKLPFPLTKLKENGWEYDEETYPDDYKMPSNSLCPIYNVSKDGMIISIEIINMSGNTKDLIDCNVGGIEVDLNKLKNADAFSLAKGIGINSSEDEIVSAYGKANTINQSGFTYSKSGYVFYRFIFNELGNSITVWNLVSTESDKTETSKEVPEYLSTYKEPTELGDDIFSFIVKIEGDLYQLPAPVSAFTDNGWVITYKPDYVVSGISKDIVFERNGKKLRADIMNFADYQTIPENCAVCGIGFYPEYKHNDDLDIELPNGISSKCNYNKEQMMEILPKTFESREDDISNWLLYSEIGTKILFNFDMETKDIISFNLETKEWQYE